MASLLLRSFRWRHRRASCPHPRWLRSECSWEPSTESRDLPRPLTHACWWPKGADERRGPQCLGVRGRDISEEIHHTVARTLYDTWPENRAFLVPALFRVEVLAALARRGEPSELLDTVEVLVSGSRFHSVAIDASLLERATAVALAARLRAYDAVYVALALIRGAALLDPGLRGPLEDHRSVPRCAALCTCGLSELTPTWYRCYPSLGSMMSLARALTCRLAMMAAGTSALTTRRAMSNGRNSL